MPRPISFKNSKSRGVNARFDCAKKQKEKEERFKMHKTKGKKIGTPTHLELFICDLNSHLACDDFIPAAGLESVKNTQGRGERVGKHIRNGFLPCRVKETKEAYAGSDKGRQGRLKHARNADKLRLARARRKSTREKGEGGGEDGVERLSTMKRDTYLYH